MSKQDSEGDENPQPSENIQRPTNEIVQNNGPKPDYIPTPKPRKKKGDDS